jgi:hypothetical protein
LHLDFILIISYTSTNFSLSLLTASSGNNNNYNDFRKQQHGPRKDTEKAGQATWPQTLQDRPESQVGAEPAKRQGMPSEEKAAVPVSGGTGREQREGRVLFEGGAEYGK